MTEIIQKRNERLGLEDNPTKDNTELDVNQLEQDEQVNNKQDTTQKAMAAAQKLQDKMDNKQSTTSKEEDGNRENLLNKSRGIELLEKSRDPDTDSIQNRANCLVQQIYTDEPSTASSLTMGTDHSTPELQDDDTAVMENGSKKSKSTQGTASTLKSLSKAELEACIQKGMTEEEIVSQIEAATMHYIRSALSKKDSILAKYNLDLNKEQCKKDTDKDNPNGIVNQEPYLSQEPASSHNAGEQP